MPSGTRTRERTSRSSGSSDISGSVDRSRSAGSTRASRRSTRRASRRRSRTRRSRRHIGETISRMTSRRGLPAGRSSPMIWIAPLMPARESWRPARDRPARGCARRASAAGSIPRRAGPASGCRPIPAEVLEALDLLGPGDDPMGGRVGEAPLVEAIGEPGKVRGGEGPARPPARRAPRRSAPPASRPAPNRGAGRGCRGPIRAAFPDPARARFLLTGPPAVTLYRTVPLLMISRYCVADSAANGSRP